MLLQAIGLERNCPEVYANLGPFSTAKGIVTRQWSF